MPLFEPAPVASGSPSVHAAGGRLRVRPGRAGITVLEMILTLTIVVVVVSIFSRMVVATSGLRSVNRENAIAAEAARVVLERMRNVDFHDVFALYDDDPDNDPDGPGTAPGRRFAVKGLSPVDTAEDGLVGEVLFPADWLEPYVEETTSTTEETLGTSVGGTPAPTVLEYQLREDLALPGLGMPRDLNGDSIIDPYDHADDYILLPVRVRLEWQGASGKRKFEIFTMLGSFNQ